MFRFRDCAIYSNIIRGTQETISVLYYLRKLQTRVQDGDLAYFILWKKNYSGNQAASIRISRKLYIVDRYRQQCNQSNAKTARGLLQADTRMGTQAKFYTVAHSVLDLASLVQTSKIRTRRKVAINHKNATTTRDERKWCKSTLSPKQAVVNAMIDLPNRLTVSPMISLPKN